MQVVKQKGDTLQSLGVALVHKQSNNLPHQVLILTICTSYNCILSEKISQTNNGSRKTSSKWCAM